MTAYVKPPTLPPNLTTIPLTTIPLQAHEEYSQPAGMTIESPFSMSHMLFGKEQTFW